MASVKDNSAKLFYYINRQIADIKEDLANVHGYLEYLRAKDLNFERQLECENEIISLEWAIKDLIVDRQFYFEYFGFTKADLNGKLYDGKAKYTDLFTREATDEEIQADWKQIEKEKDGEWGEKERKAFEKNMGMTVEQWRATVRAKF